jgi:hypothetical protein
MYPTRCWLELEIYVGQLLQEHEKERKRKEETAPSTSRAVTYQRSRDVLWVPVISCDYLVSAE